jgi:GDSL-like Lipase/Acylhydrolase family
MVLEEYMQFKGWIIKVFPLIFCQLAPFGVAFGQYSINLTMEGPQRLFWDAGSATRGGTFLQIFQAYQPNEPAQAFRWTTVTGGFAVCNSTENICLSDNGQGVVMGPKADTFALTNVKSNQAAVIDVTTHRYVEQPSAVGDGTVLVTGETPFIWTLAAAGSTPLTSPTGGSIDIMPLGDSITLGAATADTFEQGGYRCPLYNSLAAAGVRFTFVGYSYQEEPPPYPVTACSDVHWEGHGGYDIAAIQAVADGDDSFVNLQPGVVLLLGGTNDVAKYEVGNVYSQLTALLEDIYSKVPDAWVVVSSIPPMNPNASDVSTYGNGVVAGWAPNVPLANGEIYRAVHNYPQATLVDFYSAVAGNLNAYIGADGVHPSMAGYAILANLWYNAINTHIKELNTNSTRSDQ